MTVALVVDGNHERMMEMSEGITTVKELKEYYRKNHVQEALSKLRCNTHLTPACIDAICYCIEDKDMRLASIPSKTHILRGYKKNGNELFGVKLRWQPKEGGE